MSAILQRWHCIVDAVDDERIYVFCEDLSKRENPPDIMAIRKDTITPDKLAYMSNVGAFFLMDVRAEFTTLDTVWTREEVDRIKASAAEMWDKMHGEGDQ